MKNRLISTPLKYGVTCGLIIIAHFYVQKYLGLNPLLNIEGDESFIQLLLLILIIFIFIFFSLKEFRDKYNNRKLHMWEGIIGGSVTYFAIAFFSAIFIFIYLVVLEPEMTTNYIDVRLEFFAENEKLLLEKWGEDRYLLAIEEVKQTSPFHLFLDDFIKKSGIGLFLTIIIAVILRK